MSAPTRVDALIFGGGPAGSTTARQLAMLGYRVALLHRTGSKPGHLPRWETISPAALELIRAYHPDAHTSLRTSLAPVTIQRHWSLMELSKKKASPQQTILLDRTLLDEQLRASALAAGVTIAHSPIGSVRISHQRDVWEVFALGKPTWRAPFLVDAAGKRSVLNTHRNLLGARTLAIETWWSGISMPKRSTWLEALASAWLWAARGDSDLVLLTTFLSADRFAGRKAGIGSRLQDIIEKSKLAHASGGRQLKSPPRVREATASSAVDQIGFSHLRVGDASLALDPIASQGCQQALISGFQGAAVVHTCLAHPNAYSLAEKFVVTRLQENIALHLHHAREAYQQQSLFQTRFWMDRCLPGPSSWSPLRSEEGIARNVVVPTEWIQLSPLIQICDTPALIGNTIKSVPTVCHPRWTGPVAFFGSHSAVDLLEGLQGPMATKRLLENWARRSGSSPESAGELFNRLWQMGFFLPAKEPGAT
jgi:2-polyprenyl-6-methoxyphenol hydroxylase-like FAD-dependent oxidoreductase